MICHVPEPCVELLMLPGKPCLDCWPHQLMICHVYW
jgi:hypothetical protein